MSIVIKAFALWCWRCQYCGMIQIADTKFRDDFEIYKEECRHCKKMNEIMIPDAGQHD